MLIGDDSFCAAKLVGGAFNLVHFPFVARLELDLQ
jgi:hypothetical protein